MTAPTPPSDTAQLTAAATVTAALAAERAAWPATAPQSWSEHLRREFLRHLAVAGLDTETAKAELAAELAAVADPAAHLEQLVAEARVIEALGLQESLRQLLAEDPDAR